MSSWTPDGGQLLYLALPTEPDAGFERLRLMSVDIMTDPEFVAGRPQLLFERWPYGVMVPVLGYDVAPDGRFLTTVTNSALAAELLGRDPTATEPEPRTHVNVVLNWFAELKARVPTN